MATGAPTTVRFHAPFYDERELEAVRAALATHSAGDGPIGRKVEARLAQLLGAPRVLLTTSCTPRPGARAAGARDRPRPGGDLPVLHLRLERERGAARRSPAVFADIDERTLGLDPEDVERRLTPRTARAPVPCTTRASPPTWRRCSTSRSGAACAWSRTPRRASRASWRGRALGTLGDAGCLSFHETKNLSCGEGGALVISDPELAKRAEIAREKGTNRAAFFRGEVDKYTWVAEGSSYVLSDVLAAILDAQLDKLAEIQSRRAAIVARYRAGLADWAAARGVRLPAELPEREPNHHIFYLLYPDAAAPRPRARGAALARRDGHLPLRAAPLGALRPQHRRGARAAGHRPRGRRRCCACRCTRGSPTPTSTA